MTTTPSTDDRAPDPTATEEPDTGIVRELGGSWGWRFWWPLALWALVAASIATFWPDGYTTAPVPLILGGPIAVILIWAMGARSAIRHGHNRNLVRMIATVASVLVSAGSIAVGAVARVAEASIRGNDNARVFITSFGKGEDHTQFLGGNELLYIDFGLPLLAVIVVLCWFLVGRVQPET